MGDKSGNIRSREILEGGGEGGRRKRGGGGEVTAVIARKTKDVWMY